MKIMLVLEGHQESYNILSVDDENWYKVSNVLPSVAFKSTIELLAYIKKNPTTITDSLSEIETSLTAVNLSSLSIEMPFQPLSYRDFMLFEEHYICAKRGFVAKYMPVLSTIINIYERIANNTFPKLKPEKRWYQYPIYYLGNHLTFVKNLTEIKIPPYSNELDYELELGVVLCEPLKNASAEEALAAMGGFVVFNDFSARDVQADEMKCGFGPMKAKNFANSISNVVVPADEILPNIDKLKVKVFINNKLIMESDTRNMYYSLAEAVAYASWEEQLYPGEFLATGTIPGCTGIENGCMLNSGDKVRLEIEGIGELENSAI